MPIVNKFAKPEKSLKRMEPKRVLGALEQMCEALGPGGRVPNHTELMQQLSASERAVLQALGELQRTGKIIRRQRAGTFVADTMQSTGQSLVTDSITDSRTIVAITEPDDSYFSRCLDMLSRQVESADLSLVCRVISADNETRFLPPTGLSGPLGYILFRYNLAPLAIPLLENGHRVVLIGAPRTDITQVVACIHGDHDQGGYLAAKHLIDLGHRRLAFALIGADHQSLRWDGHESAIRDAQLAGLEITNEILLRETVETWKQDPALAVAYFERPDAPTGLVVWNDHEAVMLLTVLLSAGIRVPNDVSLVGYDNLPESTQVHPQLTTVDQAIGQQLRVALRLLTQPEPPLPSQTVMVTPTLVARESTAPPKS